MVTNRKRIGKDKSLLKKVDQLRKLNGLASLGMFGYRNVDVNWLRVLELASKQFV